MLPGWQEWTNITLLLNGQAVVSWTVGNPQPKSYKTGAQEKNFNSDKIFFYLTFWLLRPPVEIESEPWTPSIAPKTKERKKEKQKKSDVM